ncbi:MAG: type IV pilus secretin PilQ family protein [Pseudomonadales bacterium]|nr:type IV pilus secretin PilQ family protein [Pseudomonadales bacterium]
MINHSRWNSPQGLIMAATVFRFIKLVVSGVIASVLTVSVLAVELQDISFNSAPGGKFQIKMEFDDVPPEPAAYNIEKPARIALDLQGVQSALSQKKYTLSYGNAQSVVVLEAQDRTRVVINLVELSPYVTTVDGNALLIEVGNSEVLDPYKDAEPAIGQQVVEQNDYKVGITHIDFQRGESGEGNVVIELSDDQVDVDVRFEGQKIRIEMSDASVPSQLRRHYDVTDFATPVSAFDVEQSGTDTSITIAPQGEYDYLAYQTDNVYVLSVRPLTSQEVEEQKRAFAYTGEKLSLNFQDIKVRSVLQLIADFTELNLVTSDSVDGSITLRLQDVPWDQALELILKTKGLDKRQIGNVLMVAPAAEIAERERQEIETIKQLQELAPLQTEFIRIRYASARELFKLFDSEETDEGEDVGAGSTGSILSPRGRVVVDERTNALLITDTADKIEEFRRLIANIDVPLRQVLVEARIVVATDNFDQQVGVQWGGGAAEQGNGDRFGITGSLDSLLNEVGADDDELTSIFDFANGNGSIQFPDANFVDLGISDSIGQPQSIAVGFLSDNFALNAELSAIAAEGRGEVVSQPRVITGDKQEAEIKTGEEIPYVESSASGRSTIKFREAVLSLKVTPSITPDNRLILDLVITQDSRSEDFVFGENNSQVPIILKNEIRTQALVDNGKTIVLGGVFRESELEQETKVPLLGDIPVLGRLFKRTIVGNEKNELLIFITPRILTDRVLD